MDVKKHEKGLDFNQVILYIVGEMKNTTNIQGENKMKTIETKFRHMDDTNFITNKWDVCELQGTPKQINWADDLRFEMLTKFAIFADEHKNNPQIIILKNKMTKIASTVTDAKFYIEHHDNYASAIKAMRN